MEVLSSKILDDGSDLRLVTWVSGIVEPGQEMYQLRLVDRTGTSSIQFPIDFERRTRSEVEVLFSKISTIKQFEEERAA